MVPLTGHIDSNDDSTFRGISSFDFDSVTCQASSTGESCELNLFRLTNVQQQKKKRQKKNRVLPLRMFVISRAHPACPPDKFVVPTTLQSMLCFALCAAYPRRRLCYVYVT